jgi:hypothetical protein
VARTGVTGVAVVCAVSVVTHAEDTGKTFEVYGFAAAASVRP